MENYNKTEINGLIELTNDNVYDIDPIMANFIVHETLLGSIKNINLDGYTVSEYGNKSVASYIKFLFEKLSTIELTDEKIDVRSENKKLDEVLRSIKSCIGSLKQLKTEEKGSIVEAINEMGDIAEKTLGIVLEYKRATDEYSNILGVYVEIHKMANDELNKLLRG